MASNPTQFALASRILHWLMAAMLLSMLFIGVTMVSSLGNYHRLVAIHRPLGITILILAVIRLVNRMFTTLPPFPPTMSRRERWVATASERMLYTLMLALPLVGWGMLSAGHYPIVMFGSWHLPAILPANPALHAALRKAHTIFAYLLFVTFLAHVGAVLFHTLIVRDRLLHRMALWSIRSEGTTARTGRLAGTSSKRPCRGACSALAVGIDCLHTSAERPNEETAMIDMHAHWRPA